MARISIIAGAVPAVGAGITISLFGLAMSGCLASNKTAPPIFIGGAVGCCVQTLALLGVGLIVTVGQAVNIRRQQVNLVVALQICLSRHLALAAVTDGLLQLRKA